MLILFAIIFAVLIVGVFILVITGIFDKYKEPPGDYVMILPSDSDADVERFILQDKEGVRRAAEIFDDGKFFVIQGNQPAFKEWRPVSELEKFLSTIDET